MFLRIMGVLSYVMAIMYLIEHFYASKTLLLTYSVIGALMLLTAFLTISKLNKLIVFVLLSVGTVCFYIEGIPLDEALVGFGKNTNLLALFLLIPLIGTFMSSAGYLAALKYKVQSDLKKPHPYRTSYLLTSLIGVLLNYGAIAIVKQISAESFSNYREKKITLNIMRAFGCCMLWSPYFVNVGLILVLFDLSWFDIGGYGLILGVIYMALSWLMFQRISFQDDPVIEQKKESENSQNQRSLFPFYCFAIVLISLSLLLDFLLEANMISIVSLLSILLPLIWSIFINVFKMYITKVKEQILQSFNRLKNEFAVFISAGYFGLALSFTDIGTFLSSVLFEASFGYVYILSLFIVVICILFAQIGIHPVIIVIGVGSALSPVKFGVSPEYMALILLIAWTTSTQMSPFSGQVLMTSKIMDQSPFVITKENITFSLLLASVLTTMAYGLLVAGWI